MLDPSAGLVPARLDLRNAESAVAVPASLLHPGPLQKIVRGAADARRCRERAEAVLATLLLIVEGPAHGKECEDDEEQNLQEICGAWQRKVEWAWWDADAEQERCGSRASDVFSAEKRSVVGIQRKVWRIELSSTRLKLAMA